VSLHNNEADIPLTDVGHNSVQDIFEHSASSLNCITEDFSPMVEVAHLDGFLISCCEEVVLWLHFIVSTALFPFSGRP
jgi:hypothetical protein